MMPGVPASLLADLDVHPKVAVQILRHASFKITMEIYTQVTISRHDRLNTWQVSIAATAVQQRRYLEPERKRLVRSERVGRTRDGEGNVVIAGQPLKVQFNRILRLLDSQIPANPGRCVQLGLEQSIGSGIGW